MRTMITDGKVEIAENEMKQLRVNFLRLSEVRWASKGHFDTKMEDNMIIYSGSETKRKAGVGMILHRQTVGSLMGYNPISNRILTVRIAAKPWNLTLIQEYAPTNQATDEEKRGFYTCLQQVFRQAPKHDILIVSDDFNAKIGEGRRSASSH